jgi:hypothetical protein
MLGVINSVHVSAKDLKHMLKQFARAPRQANRFAGDRGFLPLLLDSIVSLAAGDDIKDFFYFPGTEAGYISLKSPLLYPVNGLCMTVSLRCEGGLLSRSQCLFSLLTNVRNEIKGVELWMREMKLAYRILGASKAAVHEVTFEHSEIKPHTWHTLTLLHIGKDVTLALDGSVWTKPAFEAPATGKSYTLVKVGASTDPQSSAPVQPFHGEMSVLLLLNGSSKLKEVLPALMSRGNLLQYLRVPDAEPYFVQPPHYSAIRIFQQEVVANASFIIDPNVPSPDSALVDAVGREAEQRGGCRG